MSAEEELEGVWGRGGREGLARSLEALFICRRYRDWLLRFFTKLIECSPPLRTMRQLPVELSSIGRGAAPLAPADNIKSAPIWQNSRSVMALIRCTLPASKPYPPSLYPFHAESPRAHSLFVSPQFPPQFRRYTLILIYHVPPSPPLSTYNSPRIVRSFLFFLFFFFFPSFSPPLFPFLWKEYPLTPYPARSLPLCAHPLPASHPAFTCSPLPRIMATTLPHGIGGNGIAALGFRWMWYFRFAADSFAMCFPSFVFSSPLFFFFLVILFISWFFVWEEFVDEFD